MTENRIIDEHILYNTLSHIINKKPILKVLIIGALSYNPERLCALEEYGCQLYGYWKPNPIYAYESVGPFPFGNIENIHNNRYWVEEVKKIDPDVIYTIFSATSVHFVYDSIMTLKNNDINIPFIWHLKESPQACIRYGEWPHLMELYRLSAANIFTNLMSKIWFEQFFYMNKPYMILDQDMPKKDFFLPTTFLKTFIKRPSYPYRYSRQNDRFKRTRNGIVGISKYPYPFILRKLLSTKNRSKYSLPSNRPSTFSCTLTLP